ncbi:UDP-2,4-diacetamido-2,4,6-trideoxy-beta-L-altropyranose hydrolase [Fibrobacterota bacterium]
MNVFFRADASLAIGTGHVMRCLALAGELRKRGSETGFICKEEKGHLIDLIKLKSSSTFILPGDSSYANDNALTEKILQDQKKKPDWMVVDHYHLNAEWETSIKGHVDGLMVIDDFEDREHDCDILLNQNFSLNDRRYQRMVSDDCLTLLGPKYALLRDQFYEARQNTRSRNGDVKRILVFMGGVDPDNVTLKALHAVQRINNPDISVDVVVGKNCPHIRQIREAAKALSGSECHVQIDNMAEVMVKADLCIGSGGIAAWERSSVGLPSILICMADNQEQVINDLEKAGFVIYSGWHSKISEEGIYQDITFLLRHPAIVNKMSQKSWELTDGRGAARIAEILMKYPGTIKIRPASAGDCKLVYQWRNDPRTREFFFDTSPLSWERHKTWYEAILSQQDSVLLIGEESKSPIGTIRYDFNGAEVNTSVYLDPEKTGRGYGPKLLKSGIQWIKENYPQGRMIKADILPQNKKSLQAFTNVGFRESYRMFTFEL